MSNSVEMPALGESVTEGTITRWLKNVGDTVEVDEPLLEVATDKVDTEIPSPFSGTLEKIVAEEDEVVEVGGQLAIIGDGSASSSESSSEENSEDEAHESSADEQPAEQNSQEPVSSDSTQTEQTNNASSQSAGNDSSSAEDNSSQSGETVTMPALGESVTEGTVTRWLKEVGETVDVDEPLLEVSTDKVDTEVPSPVAGTVLKHLAEEDDVVEVGGSLAIIGSADAAEDSSETTTDTEEHSDSAESSEPDSVSDSQAEEQQQTEASDTSSSTDTDSSPDDSSPSQESPKSDTTSSSASATSETATSSSGESISSAASGSVPYVTPLVRKLAKQHNVDLNSVSGTGVGGRIRKADVLAAADSQQTPNAQAASASQAALSGAQRRPAFRVEIPEEAKKLRGTTQKASRIRQVIADRMHESLQNTAQLTQTIEVDMTKVAQLRTSAKDAFYAKHSVKLSFLPFFAKAVVEALQVHPKLNAVYDVPAKEITYFDAEHLAVAVDTERGLLVPVLKNAGDMNLADIAKGIQDLAERTRKGQISPQELTGGTFTVTNIGSVGALFDTPILNTPQVGILGTGAIVKRPVVIPTQDGSEAIAVRDMVYLPLTYNHQLVDGADAGRFLQTIKTRLEDANFEADLGLD